MDSSRLLVVCWLVSWLLYSPSRSRYAIRQRVGEIPDARIDVQQDPGPGTRSDGISLEINEFWSI